MIAAWCNQQLLTPFTMEGACNRTVFEAWLETCVIPTLKPGQKLVIDNATFHKGGRIEQLVQAVGCEIWYLPPYSPDLNKIERCWSWLKSRIRKCLDQFDTLREAMEHVLQAASNQTFRRAVSRNCPSHSLPTRSPIGRTRGKLIRYRHPRQSRNSIIPP
jgi:transposase